MSPIESPSDSATMAERSHVPEYAEKGSTDVDFKADWRLYLVFATLCTLALAAALDGTCLGTALPV